MANYVNAKVQAASAAAPRAEEEAGGKCPGCGRGISGHEEFCPHCGRRLVPYCTFCGADLLPGETVCPDCGAGTGGIVCPECGTLNQRGFCRKCNHPLTKAAERVLQKAQVDPKFQEAVELSRKATETTDEKEYVRTVKSLNQILAEMLPPAGSTPQQQRNYFSARKIAVVHQQRTLTPVGWVCNFCGCTHSNPGECARPELGGQWQYTETITETTSYEYEK